MLLTKRRLDIIAKAIIGNHPQHLANLPASDDLANLPADGEVARPDGLHEEQMFLLGRLAQDPRLLAIDSEGLFAEDILARVEGQHDILKVVRVWCGHVHDVHVSIGYKLLVGAVGFTPGGGDAGVFDEFGGSFFGGG